MTICSSDGTISASVSPGFNQGMAGLFQGGTLIDDFPLNFIFPPHDFYVLYPGGEIVLEQVLT